MPHIAQIKCSLASSSPKKPLCLCDMRTTVVPLTVKTWSFNFMYLKGELTATTWPLSKLCAAHLPTSKYKQVET